MILSGKLSPEYEAVTLEMTLLNLFTSEQAYRSGRCWDLTKVTSQRSPVSGRAGEQSLLAAGPLPARLGLLARRYKVGSGGIIDTASAPQVFSVCAACVLCVLGACCVCCMCASRVWYEGVHSARVLSCAVQVRKRRCGGVG